MIIRLFCMECRRACNKWFAAAVCLMVLTEMLSSSMLFFNMSFGVDEILDMLFTGTGSDAVLLMMFPLLPYAISYARDMEEHSLEFYMVRANTVPFMAVRFLTAVFSAFACVVVSFIMLSVILLCMGHPLSTAPVSDTIEGYREFMGSNTALYLLCYTADRGLSAAMMAACAMFMSVLYAHFFFAFTSPVCLYLLALRLIFPHEVVRTWLIPSSWIDGVYSSPSGGFATLLCKVGVAALVCLVYGGLSVFLAKRRWHYA